MPCPVFFLLKIWPENLDFWAHLRKSRDMIFMTNTQSITLAGMLRARFLTAFKRLHFFTDCSPSRPHAARTISSSFCLHSEGLVSTQEQFKGACRHSAGRIMPIWWIFEFWIFENPNIFKILRFRKFKNFQSFRNFLKSRRQNLKKTWIES